MRRTYRMIDGELVEVTPRNRSPVHEIIPDIKPYKSMITGETISSRSKHRQHLRDHNCIEIGNEVDKQLHAYDQDKMHDRLDKKRHEVLVSQFADMDRKTFDNVIQNSIKQLRGH